MFCPKCGSSIPDTAQFCGSCGNPIQQRTANTPAANVPASSTPSLGALNTVSVGGSKISIMQIATVVLTVLTMIFALLPWFTPSKTVTSIGSAASQLGSWGSALTGKNINVPSFKDSYSAFDFLSLGQTLDYYNASAGGSSVFGAFFGFWLLAMILLIVGLVLFLKKGKAVKACLILGAVILFLDAICWFFMSMPLADGGYATGSAINALICAILCIITIVFAIISKRDPVA